MANVLKHLKWAPRRTRRIRSKPGTVEITARYPWLEAEVALVTPFGEPHRLFGRAFSVTRDAAG
jgi:hypothetical protein